jgi:hypothetical protein
MMFRNHIESLSRAFQCDDHGFNFLGGVGIRFHENSGASPALEIEQQTPGGAVVQITVTEKWGGSPFPTYVVQVCDRDGQKIKVNGAATPPFRDIAPTVRRVMEAVHNM